NPIDEVLARPFPCVVIAWSRAEPHRLGEAAILESKRVLGRGPPAAGDPGPPLLVSPRRPIDGAGTGQFNDPCISRVQLVLTPLPDGAIEVKSPGKLQMILGGQAVKEGVVRPGDTITLSSTLVLLVTPPRPLLQRLQHWQEYPKFPFGVADPHGIVGESPAAWALRDSLVFAARSGHHVLVLGESGVGKELAARAIHALSPRRDGPFIARNAATFPESLIDSELFGSAKSYPNVGSPERPGLLGEVDGGTLFLDEIGELPERLQVHLLRVLDGGGEYQRLGEPFMRRANFRLVAATNRPAEALKPDFLARFKVQVEVPGLDRRREDIPLLVRHLLGGIRRDTPDLVERFFGHGAGGPGEARIDPDLIEALLRRRFTLHTRELEGLLWTAVRSSPGDYLALTRDVRDDLVAAGAEEAAPPAGGETGDDEIWRHQVVAALAAAGGRVTGAAERLGVSRYALYRLMRRFRLKG
ncbi:MAG: sigma-54-dependent Fis family transcriptional regulator, partial [Polyangiaceae bacterium]|nr:sigma-54-dependent Fis family transcriptional regulator [Polyangiaceae bacterium]